MSRQRGTTLGAQELLGPHVRRETAVVWRRGDGGRRGADSAGPASWHAGGCSTSPSWRCARTAHGTMPPVRGMRARTPPPQVFFTWINRTGDGDRGCVPFSTTAQLSQKAATAVINLVLGAAIGS